MRRRVLLAGLLLMPALLHAAPAVEILGAEFGLFDASDARSVVFEPASVVPHRDGQRYGWIIRLKTRLRSVAVREEYLLPTAASEAGPTLGARGGTIPLPRRHQVSQRQLVPVDGVIIGEWAIGAGEPAGRRHLQVIVENQLAGSFEFEVVSGAVPGPAGADGKVGAGGTAPPHGRPQPMQ